MGTALIDIRKIHKTEKFSVLVIHATGTDEHILKNFEEVRATVDVIKRRLRSKGYGVEIVMN